jgi:hypothetical protein
MEGPLLLGLYATVDLPSAADWDGAIAYDTTTNEVKFSDGAVWAALGGGGGGDSVLVNAVPVVDANFNNTTPAAVGTGRNVFFQRSGSGPDSVSAYMNLFTAALAGLVPLSGGGVVNFLRADGAWAAPTAVVAATAVTVTSPYGSRDWLATVVDAAVGVGSKPILVPGIYAQTETNTPEDVQAHVESVAAGSFGLRLLAQARQTFGGPFKFHYVLG